MIRNIQAMSAAWQQMASDALTNAIATTGYKISNAKRNAMEEVAFSIKINSPVQKAEIDRPRDSPVGAPSVLDLFGNLFLELCKKWTGYRMWR